MSLSGTIFTHEPDWIHKPHSFDFAELTDKTLYNDYILNTKTNNKKAVSQSPSLYINRKIKEKKGSTYLTMYSCKRSKSLNIKTDQLRNIAYSRYSAPFLVKYQQHLTENDKPLPAIPIETTKPIVFKKKSHSFNSPSHQLLDQYKFKENGYKPLTLGDIADIKDRDKRLAAYHKAFENCLLATSPLASVIKTLKKKPPLQHHAQSQINRQTSGRTFTLPSFLQLTKKESLSSLNIL